MRLFYANIVKWALYPQLFDILALCGLSFQNAILHETSMPVNITFPILHAFRQLANSLCVTCHKLLSANI